MTCDTEEPNVRIYKFEGNIRLDGADEVRVRVFGSVCGWLFQEGGGVVNEPVVRDKGLLLPVAVVEGNAAPCESLGA